MKKLLLVLALFSVFALQSFTQESSTEKKQRDESRWTTLSYINVPILKILEGRDAYVVIYQTQGVATASTVVPKAWARGNKLKTRLIRGNLKPFMTVVKDGSDFKRVILNVPKSKADPVWSVVKDGAKVDTDKSDMSDMKY